MQGLSMKVARSTPFSVNRRRDQANATDAVQNGAPLDFLR